MGLMLFFFLALEFGDMDWEFDAGWKVIHWTWAWFELTFFFWVYSLMYCARWEIKH